VKKPLLSDRPIRETQKHLHNSSSNDAYVIRDIFSLSWHRRLRLGRLQIYGAILPLSLLGVLIVGCVDFFTGYELAFSIFYLAPVLFATWHGAWRIGFVVSLFSAAVWLAADFLGGATYSQALIPFWNASVRLVFFLLLSAMLSKLASVLDAEHGTARTDQLTGAYNSRAFYELMDIELSRSRRYARPFTLAYFDLDNFKAVNDLNGHDVGDQLLKTVIEILRTGIRQSDILARLGGDEFVILFTETDFEQSQNVVNKIHKLLCEKMSRDCWPVTVSGGAVTFASTLPVSSQEIISQADQLMYEAKKAGKNRVVFKIFQTISKDSVS
jgi:diguanylate cyclase (GGDEF)-like protein